MLVCYIKQLNDFDRRFKCSAYDLFLLIIKKILKLFNQASCLLACPVNPHIKYHPVKLLGALLSHLPVDIVTVLLQPVDPSLIVRVVNRCIRFIRRALLRKEEALSALGRTTFH
jgi:hypothetical protein